MNKLIIGLSGKAEHGKTEAAKQIKIDCRNYLNYSHGAEIIEISNIIIEHCVALGLLPADLPRADFNKAQIQILVDEGTRMRAEDPNYWVIRFLRKIKASDKPVVVIPNLRFVQEAQAIRNAGGVIIRIQRINADGSPFVSETRDPNHPCETSLDTWPADFYVINKTGHPELFCDLVSCLFQYIEIGRSLN